MALNEKDHWVAILGLAGVAAGYWYWSNRNQSTSDGNLTAANQTADQPGGNTLIPGMDQTSVNVTTPTMVYNPGSSINTPIGIPIQTGSQAFTLPVNS